MSTLLQTQSKGRSRIRAQGQKDIAEQEEKGGGGEELGRRADVREEGEWKEGQGRAG